MKTTNHILLKLYEVSADSFLHPWSQGIITSLFFPFVRLVFLTLNPKAIELIARHSIKEKDGFNLFMSDIDVTILADKHSSIPMLLKNYFRIKHLLPILGEPEIHVKQEWQELHLRSTPELDDAWSTIFQMRKLRWQEKSLLRTYDRYHRSKLLRGLERTKKKLKTSTGQVSLQKVLSTLPLSQVPLELPVYLMYFQSWLAVEATREESLVASSPEVAWGFYQLIPGNQSEDPSLRKSPLREFLCRKEILMSQSQLDLSKFQDESFNTLILDSWIQKLTEQLRAE
ncbi:MAG TPA: hypothetical protein VNJ01_10095 [Bacteriovoracaceae bacterium]|nr:hypothetical protein [Bacteriovoracaceae bacterium]